MRISELIAELGEVLAERGDIEVAVYDEEGGEWNEIEKVEHAYCTVFRTGSYSMIDAACIVANYDV